MIALKKILDKHFIKYSLMPILIIEVMLLVIYFGINSYISEKTSSTLKNDTLFNNAQLLGKEVEEINTILSEISDLTKLMQKDHERVFENPKYFNIINKPTFNVASNGVFYKETKKGASLYYSSKTIITEKEKNKAIFTEAMDPLLKNIVEFNENIVAAYFNSYDNMNRLYPYIEKVYEQYGEHIHMEDYNFYYLADKKHNPKKGVSWTDAYLDPAGNGWMISAIAPIYNGDFLEGVSGIDFTIEKLVSNVLEKELPFEGKMFLVDSKGMILAMPESIEKLLGLEELKKHTYKNAITQTVLKPEDFNLYKNETPFAKLFKDMIQKNKHTSQISINNSKYIALSNKVEQTGWILFTVIKEDKIFESTLDLKEFSNLIGYIAIAFMALFYLIFFYMIFKKATKITDTIATPINHLSKLTSTILDGESKKLEYPETKIEEIHKLSTNFNKMSIQLDERTKNLLESKDSLKKANIELKKLNDELDKRVKDEVRKNREKDLRLFEQAKLASMGEMIGNIAHQWRQPLSAISSASSGIILQKQLDDLPDEDLLKACDRISNHAQYLSKTIDDFRNFIKNDKAKIKFNILDSFNTLYKLLEGILNDSELKVIKNIDSSIEIEGYPNELIQCCMNILNNAKDALEDKEGEKFIFIDTYLEDKILKIVFKDNAGGIREDALPHVFDPYFTTKHKSQGTGLGLSMTHSLIVEGMKGTISAKNTKFTYNEKEYFGAEFVISIPIG